MTNEQFFFFNEARTTEYILEHYWGSESVRREVRKKKENCVGGVWGTRKKHYVPIFQDYKRRRRHKRGRRHISIQNLKTLD
jgi:hypothetical protein